MTFSESNAFFGSEKLTLISFQMLFFGLTETFTSIFTWNKENLKTIFSSWIVKEWHFQKVFLCLQIRSINIYLLLNIVPGLAQTVHEKLAEFGDTKPVSLRMNNDFKTNLVLTSCNKSLIVFKCGFGLAQICSSNAQWNSEVMKHLFDASLRKNGTSGKSFGFRKHEINFQVFSNMVFGLGRTLVRFVY